MIPQNYELERRLAKEKNRKRYWIDERWIGWKNNDIVSAFRPYTYNYLTDDNEENRKEKDMCHETKTYFERL